MIDVQKLSTSYKKVQSVFKVVNGFINFFSQDFDQFAKTENDFIYSIEYKSETNKSEITEALNSYLAQNDLSDYFVITDDGTNLQVQFKISAEEVNIAEIEKQNPIVEENSNKEVTPVKEVKASIKHEEFMFTNPPF